MNFVEFASTYALERHCSNDYRKSLICTARQFADFAGGQCTEECVNHWLESFVSRGQFVTAKNKRTMIGVLWRAAADRGLIDQPRRFRRIKVPSKSPEALTQAEVKKLIDVAKKLEGCFQRTSVSRRLYFASLYNAYYDTALRLGDLRSIERDWIWPGGFVSIVQHKVNRSHQVQLRRETIALIDELCAGRKTGLIWGALNKKNFGSWQRKLFKQAGIRGTGKWIRRTSASYVELHNPGMGWRHLGHAAPGLAERFYIDPNIVRKKPTLPPKLTG